MSETPEDPIVGKHDKCGGDIAECLVTKIQYCLECAAVVKAPEGAIVDDVDKWAEDTIRNAEPEEQQRSRPMSGRASGMMIATVAAMAAGGMAFTGVDRASEPDFQAFGNFSVGGKGKRGGRPSHTNRDKAKAARKARRKNRK